MVAYRVGSPYRGPPQNRPFREHTPWNKARRRIRQTFSYSNVFVISGAGRAAIGVIVLALTAALVLGAGTTRAQTPVCSDMPGSGERIECIEDADSTNLIDIDAVGVDIDTSGDNEPGVHAKHEGEGDIDVNVSADDSGGQPVKSTIGTTGLKAPGIHGEHTGTGKIGLDVRMTDITTNSNNNNIAIVGHSHGVHGHHTGNGVIDIDAQGLAITTTGRDEDGIKGVHEGSGDVNIDVSGDTSITTSGQYARGVQGWHQGDGDVRIEVKDSTITTMDYKGEAILGRHCQVNQYDTCITHSTTGDLYIDVENTGITTKGDSAHSVFGEHSGTGDLYIKIKENAEIATEGISAYGVYGVHKGDGALSIDVQSGAIGTADIYAHGVFGLHSNSEGAGRLDIAVQESTITTGGHEAHGVYGLHKGAGHLDIYVKDSAITTTGVKPEELSFLSSGPYGVHAHHQQNSIGNVTIDVQSGVIGTADTYAHGVYGLHRGDGHLITHVKDGATITTTGDEAHGVYGEYFYGGDGDIFTDVQDGATTIATTGDNAHGVYGRRWGGAGNVDIAVRSASITTTGVSAHGLYALNNVLGNQGDIRIATISGASIEAKGANASGIRIGDLDSSGQVQGAAQVGEDGYRKQIVQVNSRVWGGTGEAAGVFLAGGGRLIIGPGGSVGAASGISVLATGDSSGVKPRLHLTLLPIGHRIADLIGNGYILNDGGETTIVVNGVKLHDGVDGATGLTAQNGAWYVTLREDGVTVDRSTDPWTISPRGSGVITDRDFSAEDFGAPDSSAPPEQPDTGNTPDTPGLQTSETPGPPDSEAPDASDSETPDAPDPETSEQPDTDNAPEPPVSPDSKAPETPDSETREQPDTGEDSVMPENTPEPSGKITFTEEYAPRAALYEALPGFLLRLNGGGPAGERLRSPGSPVWARLTGSRGSHEPDRSTVGQEYDFERFEAEAGLDAGMGEHFTGSISVRHVRGSAEVSSPFGGGDIEAEGIGVSLGASWKGPGGYYANGSLSLTDYDLDVSSGDTNVGTLKRDVASRGTLLSLEAGRRIKMSERMNLTPRAWLARSAVSVDAFTDKVDARVSVAETARFTGGVGVAAQTAWAIEGGSFSLRGSLDLTQTLDDAETAVDVSGERLESKSAKTRLLLGLGGVYRKGRFSVSGEVSMGGLGSEDTQYSGQVSFGMRF